MRYKSKMGNLRFVVSVFLALSTCTFSIDSSSTQQQEIDSQQSPEVDSRQKYSNLLIIGQGNITETLHIDPPGHPSLLLVALYAPWCRHCEPLLQKMNEASIFLSDVWRQWFFNSDIIDSDLLHAKKPLIGKIDATIEKNLAHYFGIKGYPTLKLILSFPNPASANLETNDSKTKHHDTEVYIFDYEDKSKSRDSITSFILHYWFRFIYSPIPKQKDAFPVIWVNGADELFYTLNSYNDLLFRVTNDFEFMGLGQDSNIDTNGEKGKTQNTLLQNDLMGEEHRIAFVLCFDEVENHVINDTNHEEKVIKTEQESIEQIEQTKSNQNPDTDEINTLQRIAIEKEFKKAAFEMIERRDIAFFAMESSSCHDIGFSKESPMKAIFAPFDQSAIRNGPLYTPDSIDDTHSVMKFIKEQSAPRLIWFERHKNASLVFKGDFAIHICLFVHIPDNRNPKANLDIDAHTKKAISIMKESADKYAQHDESVFLIVPNREQRIVDYFGVKTFPTLMITDMRQQNGTLKYFLSTHEIIQSEDSIPLFYEQFYKDKLQPTLKSQALSKADTEKQVKIVKGDSFNSMVMEGSKHALVNFYAPWCAHCKHLTPKWNKLAATIAESKEWVNKIDIMKMDATKNEVAHPSVDIIVFPSIYFFPLGNKTQPIRYEGNGTDPDDFIEWFSSYELKLDETKRNVQFAESTSILQDEL